jgi:predicted alpha/beta hydrolase
VRFPGSGAVTVPGSMEGPVLRRALANLPEDLPYGVLAQFADWARSGDFRDAAGTTSWRDGLAAVRTPMLFVAGSRDLLAGPDAVRPAYERLGSPDKELRLVGKEHGQAAEYGHGDLLVGRRAPEEVFPLVGDWLERHDLTSR